MQVKTQGLIIKEQTIGESDRLVTVLTKDAGVLRAFARRAKNLKDSKSAATQLLCYSHLSVFKGREKYIIDDAEPIEVFFGLRRDIAALSLALGLSEEIQASAGGIRLDTMFVDEGFGSLDEETLQQAMKALHLLSEGNRLVGIISHVSELRRQIDSQVIVTKEKSGGSNVTVVVGEEFN